MADKDVSDQEFGIRRAADLSGLAPAMVDYLCRSGVLIPSGGRRPGRGRGRVYKFGDVVMLRALRQLLKSGISVAKLKNGLESLRSRHQEITIAAAPRFLVTDGARIYFRDDGSKLIEELSANGQIAFAFVIKLREVQQHVVHLLEKSSQKASRSEGRTRRVVAKGRSAQAL
jgi:DNA-binding transcriptional MerR regulator